MDPEMIKVITTSLLAFVGSITALITTVISSKNGASKEEVEDLRKRVDELKAELQAERESNAELRMLITAANDSLVEAAAEKRDLRMQLDEMKTEIIKRDKQIKELQETIEKQAARNRELEARVTELEARLKIYEGGKTNDKAD